jgi:hypothetical protein
MSRPLVQFAGTLLPPRIATTMFTLYFNWPYNHRLKQPARPVTPLALDDGGPGTDPGSARSAPALAAAYPGRYMDLGNW